MRNLPLLTIACVLLASCSQPDDRSACTEKSVGRDLGSAVVTLTLLVPDHFMTGVEISNGGILAFGQDCDTVVNAFFSRETANYLIERSANFPLRHTATGSTVAQAEMLVWKFDDGSGESRFFVDSVMEVKPATTPPHMMDAKNFEYSAKPTAPRRSPRA